MAADAERLARKQRAQKSMPPYPKASVLMLKSIFDEYDIDKSGAISRNELHLALNKRKQQAQRFDPQKKTNLAQRQASAGRARGQPSDSPGHFLVDFTEELFDALDADGDETIEFSEVLRIVYPRATSTEVKIMVAWATPVPTECEIRKQELRLAEERRLDSLRAMFNAYDRNGDGKVSITEFRMAMLDHENWDEVDALFEQYDANGNGEVDFEEFCAIVSPEEED